MVLVIVHFHGLSWLSSENFCESHSKFQDFHNLYMTHFFPVVTVVKHLRPPHITNTSCGEDKLILKEWPLRVIETLTKLKEKKTNSRSVKFSVIE